MNLPNSLTITRIFLVPLLLVVLLTSFPDREIWALVVFLAAAMTDYLDGYLARKRLQVTNLGKLLDPIADKLLISAALVALVELKMAPAWMVVIIIGREFAVTGLRSIASAEGLTIDASSLGKSKMVSQVLCVGSLIAAIRYPETPIAAAGTVLLWIVVTLAMVSMIDYFHRFWSQIDEHARSKKRLEHLRRLRLLRKQQRSSDALINT